MKLVVAVVQSEDANGLLSQLSNRGFRATRIKTVGGFLREANATVFIGVEEEDVETVVQTIREAFISSASARAATSRSSRRSTS